MGSSVGGAGGGEVEGERAASCARRFEGEVRGALWVSESEDGSSSLCRLDGLLGLACFERAVEAVVAVLLFSQGSVRVMLAKTKEEVGVVQQQRAKILKVVAVVFVLR